MQGRSYFIAILIALTFSSCERAIDFELDGVDPKLVVEATIENGQEPMVVLSNSLGFFSTVDPATLANSFVRNAEVYVSNGTLTHRLKEYAVPVGGGFNFYYYSNDPASPSTAFTGELNKTYNLRIVTAGKEYTAQTRIPSITRRVDSLYWKPAPPGNEPNKVTVMIKAYDPPGLGDYIRYFTKQNGQPFYPGFISVFDDQVIDGSSFDVPVERGIDRNAGTPEGYNFFNKGDTVVVKICNIDKAHFDFWRTMEFAYTNGGNPFSTPTKVLSNIQGGGLGYFGGLAAQYHQVIIPQ